MIGSLGLYLDGLAPSMTPPCGGALFDDVGDAAAATLVATDITVDIAGLQHQAVKRQYQADFA